MDGGGIEPDIKIDESERSEFEEALIRRSAFSRFAGTYAASVDTLPVDFEVDDGLLYAFRDWIGDNPEFDYVTEAERQLETFREEFREGDYQESLEVLEDLESAIIRDKARDFDRDRVRIRERLRRALIARFYPETDQIEAALRHDQLVLSAIDLFKDPERYHELLHP